jgi:hypothetical protein
VGTITTKQKVVSIIREMNFVQVVLVEVNFLWEAFLEELLYVERSPTTLDILPLVSRVDLLFEL